MYILCPLTRTFNVDESRPLIVPHKCIQPVEVLILDCIHDTNYNHKLYNLIQNTPHEFSPQKSHAPWTNSLVDGMNRSPQEYLKYIIIGKYTKYTE